MEEGRDGKKKRKKVKGKKFSGEEKRYLTSTKKV